MLLDASHKKRMSFRVNRNNTFSITTSGMVSKASCSDSTNVTRDLSLFNDASSFLLMMLSYGGSKEKQNLRRGEIEQKHGLEKGSTLLYILLQHRAFYANITPLLGKSISRIALHDNKIKDIAQESPFS